MAVIRDTLADEARMELAIRGISGNFKTAIDDFEIDFTVIKSPTITPLAPANDQPTSIMGRLKRGVSNFVDSVRPYRVPEEITPTSISLERNNFVRITTKLGTHAQERDGVFSDPQEVVRERDVWVKLDDASYQHLADMAVHYPMLEKHTLTTTGLSALQDMKKSARILDGAFNQAAAGKVDGTIDYIKGIRTTIRNGQAVNPNKTVAEIVGEAPTVTKADLDRTLNSIAGLIKIKTNGGYVTPRDGENRALAEGEYITGTAEFTGFGHGHFLDRYSNVIDNSSETIEGKFGLRKAGLSPKTRELANRGLNKNIRDMTPQFALN